MATIKAFEGETWRDEFNLFEMHFFGIVTSDWPIKSRQKIQQIDQNYGTPPRHQVHVAGLNAKLNPFPPLVETDFDKTITLIALRETVIADRMAPTPTGIVDLKIPTSAKDLRAAGLGHLLVDPTLGRTIRRRKK